MKKLIIGKWNKSVILTYIGLAFSILGIYLAVTNNIKYAICALMVSGICDLFDGFIARRCKRDDDEKKFGVELDSLVDVMSFIALPIAIGLGMGFNKWYAVVSYILYAIFGICRLAYFNIKVEHSDKPVKYYSGLPVTYAALIFALIYFLRYAVSEQLFEIVYSICVFVTSILFILNVKIRKPNGIAYVFFTMLFICSISLYMVVLK